MLAKVCILTSVHTPFDTRIFHKEAKSLAKAGYNVTLIAQHDKDEVVDGIRIVPLPKPKNRIERMTRTVWLAYRKALEFDADIYHFHDPELIPIGLLLKLHGKQVIYDIHEDYVTAINQKGYLPITIRKMLAIVIGRIELMLGKYFALILAEKYYSERFPHGTKILNYPILQQRNSTCANTKKNKHELCLIYTGGISVDRGALIHANIVNLLSDIEMWMIGRCTEKLAVQLYDIAGNQSAQLHIEGIGYHVPHKRILEYYVLHKWTASLAIFPPTKHYEKKELTKFFEYMAAAIPIISSNFPAWKQIVERERCGICVDPLNPKEIAGAVQFIVEHPAETEQMGKNGRRAVKERYNWDMEERKLLDLYQELIIQPQI